MTKYVVARNTENTLNHVVVPIIFVPGVMGTRLGFDNQYINDTDVEEGWKTWLDRARYVKKIETPGQAAWDPDNATKMAWLAVVKTARKKDYLRIEQPARVIDEESALKKRVSDEQQVQLLKKRGFTGISSEFYLNFLLKTNELYNTEAEAMPVYAFGYDWRMSNVNSGLDLAKKINEILTEHQARQCIIVTHSMGGLVTRSALKQDPSLEKKVAGVVHVFQPVNGAPVLYRRFFTGVRAGMKEPYDSSQSFSVISTPLSKSGEYLSTSAIEYIFSLILGETATKFSELLSVMQGPVELLPNNRYSGLWLNIHWDHPRVAGRQSTWIRSSSENYPPIPRDNVYGAYLHSLKPYGLSGRAGSELYRRLMGKVQTAYAFHHAFLHVYKHPSTWAVAGSGLNTDIKIEFEYSIEVIKEIVAREQGLIARIGELLPPIILPSPIPGVPPITLRNRRQPSPLKNLPIPRDLKSGEAVAFRKKALELFNDEQLLELVLPMKKTVGDGTVPAKSGWGLFESEENISPDNFDFLRKHQATVNGIEHGAAFNSDKVQKFAFGAIEHIRNTKIQTDF